MMQDLRERKNELLSDKISIVDVNRYLLLEKDLDTLTRKLNRETKIQEQNKKSFDSITKALVGALISKKKKL